MFISIVKLPRKIKQFAMVIFDSVAIMSCIFLSLALRFDDWYFLLSNSNLIWPILYAPLIGLPTFWIFGLYHEVVRYVGIKTLITVVKTVALYAILWSLLGFMLQIEGVPRSVVLINWVILTIIVSGSRLVAQRLIISNVKKDISTRAKKILIYGAGEAGRQLSIAISSSRDYKLEGFIDDDGELHTHFINGLKVYSVNNLKKIIENKEISEILLAIPSLSRVRRNEIISYLNSYNVIVRTLPSVKGLLGGKVKVDDLLEIDIRDLLGRKPVEPNKELLSTKITNKVVMVTGAGGSIGSELCRQITLLKPTMLILYEISEFSLYRIQQELLNNKTEHKVEIHPVLGSVLDKNRVESICKSYAVKTIYHAAAYKHVPLVEFNSSQGVLNNAIGTMLCADGALNAKVETFVLISTDKAVRPSSIMGASKRVAELVLQAYSKKFNSTCFTMVRFGNVLGSSGSVIPLFKKQIKQGGPITVTHPDMVRYFMTIPEAVELVIQAGAIAKGGEVFVLDMGEPMSINDLAVKMINLSGLKLLDKENPEGDIEIKYTGLRPGEKLFEELLLEGNFNLTQNKLIMRAEEKMLDYDELIRLIQVLQETASTSNNKRMHQVLKKLIPEFIHKNQ